MGVVTLKFVQWHSMQKKRSHLKRKSCYLEFHVKDVKD